MRDLTTDYDYSALLAEEIEHYGSIEVTDDLREGGLHDGDAWHHYWLRVGERIDRLFVSDIASWLERRFADLGRPLRLLSLGSGYCGHELHLAERLSLPHEVVCTDINPDLFTEARRRADEGGLTMRFERLDLNFLDLEPGRWDFIFAHAAVHHIINLEYFFDQVQSALAPDGVFHLIEVVGKNRQLIWDESQDFANRLLDSLPQNLIGADRLAVKAEDAEGMEGVRQEEILPLLRERFEPIFELRHGAFIRFVAVHAQLGPRLDPADPERRRLLDFLIDCDEAAVRRGILEPLELWGVYRSKRK